MCQIIICTVLCTICTSNTQLITINDPLDGISSRSSSLLENHLNITNSETAKTPDDYDSSENVQLKWKWAWQPENKDLNHYPHLYYHRPTFYQKAESRQGFLALLNPSTLVSHENSSK